VVHTAITIFARGYTVCNVIKQINIWRSCKSLPNPQPWNVSLFILLKTETSELNYNLIPKLQFPVELFFRQYSKQPTPIIIGVCCLLYCLKLYPKLITFDVVHLPSNTHTHTHTHTHLLRLVAQCFIFIIQGSYKFRSYTMHIFRKLQVWSMRTAYMLNCHR